MRVRISVAGICFLLAATVTAGNALAQSTATHKPAEDAYAPLWLYNGSWGLETAGGNEHSKTQISNHCEKTGLFFVCEQVIGGKSEDLVVFVPTGASGITQSYRTMGLSAGGETPGDWGKLEISGDRWVYSSEETDKGSKVYWRTINLFSGRDKIHFEIQRSVDGKTWETRRSGDEHRTNK